MKNLKINLNVIALVLGLTFAFIASAFTEKEELNLSGLSTGWYKTNPDGSILQPYEAVTPSAFCEGSEVYCAKEYNLNIEGEPISETETPAVMRNE